MNANPEEWRPVVGWEGLYEISSHGRVLSSSRIVRRSDGRDRKAPARMLKLWTTRKRYIGASLKHQSQRRTVFVHTLVLEAFVGPRPDGLVCCHGDGNPQNNTVENLRWGTARENSQDALRHGTNHNSRKTHCVNGHPFTPDNTMRRPEGGRRCRICKQEASRRTKARAKARLNN